MFTFLTPGFFDILVILTVVIGMIAAVLRIIHDFRSGPRWPDAPAMPTSIEHPEQQENHTK